MHPLEPAKPLHDAQMCGSFFLYDEQQNPIPETIRPMLPNRMTGSWITLPTDALRIYFNLCIIKYFLNIISPNNRSMPCSPLTRPSTSPPWASLADGRSNLCGNNRRFVTLLFQIFTKPLNICSDFHLGRHFFGHVGGFFVGLFVTSQSKIIKSK